MIKRIAVLFFITLFVSPWQHAASQIQKGNALFEQLTTENGLSSNEVNCLFQDSRGFIWIGTNNGLNRYDGVDIIQYFNTTNSNSIVGNRINSIREDNEHHLWIGTNDGVSRFEVGKNKFTNYLNTPNEIEQLKKASMFNVAIDSDDNLWVTSNFHLSFFDKGKKQFIHYKIDNGENLPITRNYNIRSVFEDSKKRLWIPTSFGVKLFNRATKKFTSLHFPEKEKALPENFVTAIKETPQRKIIASTWGGGILIFNESLQRFEKLFVYEEEMPRRNLINIVIDILPVEDKLYCASSEGLLVIQEKDVVPGTAKNYSQYTYTENSKKGINSQFCASLLKDKTGTLWIATKGVNKIDPLKQQFKNTLLTKNNLPLSISGVGIYNNGLLLGAQDAYLYADDNLKPLGFTDKMESDYGPQVWDVYAGKSYCWLATTNGLIQTTKEGKFIKQFIHQKNNPATIAGERLWRVYEDSKGLVWLGSVRRGISILNPADGSIKNYFSIKEDENSLFNSYINDFFEDSKSNIWFPSRGDKLYCYNRASQSFTIKQINLENGAKILWTPQIITMLPNGELLLASQRGILQFNSETQKAVVKAFHTDMTVVKHTIATKNGHFWMVTGNGLLHYNTSTNIFKRYTTLNGLTVNEDIDVIKNLPDGKILLAGLGFISVFNPDELGNNRNIPPVHITQVVANSKDSLFEHENYSLPYLSGIRFDFASLNFSNAAQNMYKYRLAGIDTNWSQPMHQRSVSYAQLPPGQYTFEVMGSNGDGLWNQNPATFSFSINRPFYKTWWFYALVALTIAGLIYAFYRYRLGRALELEKMRTRIATDLHDDIGATLSSISMYSESLKGMVKDTFPQLGSVLDKMGENSREMVTGMSDIVWAINPQNDTGEKLLGRMESYATDMCAVKNIQLRFAADKKLNDAQLSLEQRKNIYLIFKEAINNAVKYSGAKNVDISIRQQGKQITLIVKDNGIGFDEQTIKKGNGLNNLRLRAEEIKGKLEIISIPEKGTTIQLMI